MNLPPGATKPRMGRIEYLNVLPVYHALETGLVPHGYELVYAPPSTLNNMMMRDELAISSTSCVEYARRPEKYRLLPDLAIGSKGKVMSVLLISRVPVEKLGGKTILISTATHTSVLLLKLLLKEYVKLPASFSTGDASKRLAAKDAHGARPEKDAPEAMLVIGDEALSLRSHPLYPYIWDLGGAWHDWTGLPFTFGLWVVNRKTAAEGGLAENPAKLLHAGRDWSLANRDRLLDAAEANCSLSREELGEYFACLSYKLGSLEQQGLRLFYEHLARSGEIEQAPELAFWPLD